jgi:hypothetical protein
MTYAQWLKIADRRVGKLTDGKHSRQTDLLDWWWKDAFEEGMSATEAARRAVVSTFGQLD